MSTWHWVSGALRGQRVLELYCDGSAEEKVGTPGGWAFLVVRGDEVLISRTGSAPKTTSLVMELVAARSALKLVVGKGWHTQYAVELISDSSITLDVAAGRFMPKRNEAVGAALRKLAVQAGARTRWVRAHSGHRWNEAVDGLAREAKEKARTKPSF